MRLFHFYVDDARHAEPRVIMVEVRDEVRARELAERVLADSEHHDGVEVCEDGKRVLGLGSFADRSWCGTNSKRRASPYRRPELPRLLGTLLPRRSSGGLTVIGRRALRLLAS